VNPLRCPFCQNPMRVIAVIDDWRVVNIRSSTRLGCMACNDLTALSPSVAVSTV